MSTHNPFSFLNWIFYPHYIHLTCFCSNNHLFKCVAWKRDNHIWWTVSLGNDYSILLFKFCTPNYDLPCFISRNKWLGFFSSCQGRHWSWMATNCFYTFLFLPKVDRSVSHTWNHILFLFAFIGTPERFEAIGWRNCEITKNSSIGIESALIKRYE